MSANLPDNDDLARWAGPVAGDEVDRLIEVLRQRLGPEEARQIEARTEELLAAIRDGTPPPDQERQEVLYAFLLALQHVRIWGEARE